MLIIRDRVELFKILRSQIFTLYIYENSGFGRKRRIGKHRKGKRRKKDKENFHI